MLDPYPMDLVDITLLLQLHASCGQIFADDDECKVRHCRLPDDFGDERTEERNRTERAADEPRDDEDDREHDDDDCGRPERARRDAIRRAERAEPAEIADHGGRHRVDEQKKERE